MAHRGTTATARASGNFLGSSVPCRSACLAPESPTLPWETRICPRCNFGSSFSVVLEMDISVGREQLGSAAAIPACLVCRFVPAALHGNTETFSPGSSPKGLPQWSLIDATKLSSESRALPWPNRLNRCRVQRKGRLRRHPRPVAKASAFWCTPDSGTRSSVPGLTPSADRMHAEAAPLHKSSCIHRRPGSKVASEAARKRYVYSQLRLARSGIGRAQPVFR